MKLFSVTLLTIAVTLLSQNSLAQSAPLTPRLTPRLRPRPTPTPTPTPTPEQRPDSPSTNQRPAQPKNDPQTAPPRSKPSTEKPPPPSNRPLVPRLTPRPSPSSQRPAPDASTTTPQQPNAASPAPSPGPTKRTQTEPESTQTDEAAEEKEKNSGFYIAGGVGLMFGLVSTHEWSENCPGIDDPAQPQLNWAPSCTASSHLGPSFEGHLGYRFGTLGVELFGLGAADWSVARLSDTPDSVPVAPTDMLVGRAGFGGGLGMRLSGTGFLRPSVGVGVGGMFRHVFTSLSSLDGSSVNYGAPLIKADLTLTLGGLFNLGLLGWIEFAPTVEVRPNLEAASGLGGIDLDNVPVPNDTTAAISAFENAIGDVTVFKGPQYFVGPYIGIHLGK